MYSPQKFTIEELKQKRADLLMAWSPLTLSTEWEPELDEIERKLRTLYPGSIPKGYNNEDVDEYETVQMPDDMPVEQFLYDPLNSSEETFEEIGTYGNGLWRHALAYNIEKEKQHHISRNTCCQNKDCPRVRCRCSLIPPLEEQRSVEEVVKEIEELEQKTDEQIEQLVIEEMQVEEDEMFKENIDTLIRHTETVAALRSLKYDDMTNEELFKQAETRGEFNLMHRIFSSWRSNVGLKQCDYCLKWCKTIVPNVDDTQSCSDCFCDRGATLNTKYEDKSYVIKVCDPSNNRFLLTDDLREVKDNGEFSIQAITYHKKDELPTLISGTYKFKHEKLKVSKRRAGTKLLFTEAEAIQIVNARDVIVNKRQPIVKEREDVAAAQSIHDALVEEEQEVGRAAQKKATTKVAKKVVLEKRKNSKRKRSDWRRRATSVSTCSSSSSRAMTLTYPTDLITKSFYDMENKKSVKMWHCPLQSCKWNKCSCNRCKKRGDVPKMHDWQKSRVLKRHLVDTHRCQLFDTNGNPIPDYSYTCYHPTCREREFREKDGSIRIGIRHFHEFSQYKRHLENVHHRLLVKGENGKYHVKGYEDHIIEENFTEMDKCKWWTEPANCDCWRKPEKCHCIICQNKKNNKRRKV